VLDPIIIFKLQQISRMNFFTTKKPNYARLLTCHYIRREKLLRHLYLILAWFNANITLTPSIHSFLHTYMHKCVACTQCSHALTIRALFKLRTLCILLFINYYLCDQIIMRMVWLVLRLGEVVYVYRMLVPASHAKRKLTATRCRWKDNIKSDV